MSCLARYRRSSVWGELEDLKIVHFHGKELVDYFLGLESGNYFLGQPLEKYFLIPFHPHSSPQNHHHYLSQLSSFMGGS